MTSQRKSLPKYCWDSNVYLAWLAQEPDKPLDCIELIINEIESQSAVLIFPVTILPEVIEVKPNPAALDEFRRFLQRSSVRVMNITLEIAEKAGRIRQKLKTENQKSLKLPDALIIATAILSKADALHTFDTGLLTLNGTAVVDNLRITKPASLSGQDSLL